MHGCLMTIIYNNFEVVKWDYLGSAVVHMCKVLHTHIWEVFQ